MPSESAKKPYLGQNLPIAIAVVGSHTYITHIGFKYSTFITIR